ncbi:hypothetical protein M0R45_004303 [Rubus argutus]|uniref:Protein kinase domain-containing protein n=1 Tax=Rubus argutus TaxID=59490 RepID=A0AAW1YJC0_RUBAR
MHSFFQAMLLHINGLQIRMHDNFGVEVQLDPSMRIYIEINICGANNSLYFYNPLKTKLQSNPECVNNWITKKECAQTFEDLVLGLQHIHAEEIMHGDIPGANILFRNGVAKITDFGLARTIGAGDDEDELIGFSLYRAPERKHVVAKANHVLEVIYSYLL